MSHETLIELSRDKSTVFCENGKYLSSRYSPKKEAERILESVETTLESGDALVLLGAGQTALVENLLKKNIKTYIVERNKKIIQHYKESLPRAIEEQALQFLLFDEKEMTLNASELSDLFSTDTIKIKTVIQNPSQRRLHPDFFANCYNQIKAESQKQQINLATLSRFEHLWLRNICKNTAKILKSFPVSALNQVAKGQTALVLGAGPGLSPLLKAIKAMPSSVYIIAVDTVYPVLLKQGIYPDMVVVVDPQKVNARYLENIDNPREDKTCFLFEPAICHTAIRDKNNCIGFDTIFPLYHLIARSGAAKGILEMGGSVSCTAISAVIHMGFEKCFLAGMDLSIREEAYHVPGTLYEQYWFSNIERLKPYSTYMHKISDLSQYERDVNYDNERVYVDAKFRMFARWTEKKIKAQKHVRFYQLSSKSLKIDGIDIIDTTKATEMLGKPEAENSFKEKLLLAFKQFQGETARPDLIANELTAIYSDIEGTLQKCERALKLIQNPKNHSTLHRELEKIELSLLPETSARDFINLTMQGFIRELNKEEKSDDPMSGTKEFYKSLKKSCEWNLRYLPFALANVAHE